MTFAFRSVLVAMTLCLAITVPGVAAVVHDESVDGDLSNDPAAPTSINLSFGSNTVNGTVGDSHNLTTGDIDFLTFTIQPGQTLGGLFLLSLTPNDTAFHGIGAGSTAIVPSGPNVGDPSQFLGSDHLFFTAADENLLPGLGSDPAAGMGFAAPLGAGTYAYIIQQTGGLTQGYSLDFTVTPEPSTMALITLLGLVFFRRRVAG